jgi:hypothetical protein
MYSYLPIIPLYVTHYTTTAILFSLTLLYIDIYISISRQVPYNISNVIVLINGTVPSTIGYPPQPDNLRTYSSHTLTVWPGLDGKLPACIRPLFPLPSSLGTRDHVLKTSSCSRKRAWLTHWGASDLGALVAF